MPQIIASPRSFQQSKIERDQPTGVLPIFIQKLNSETPQPSPLQPSKILSTGLRLRVEDSVPAADVRFHQMSLTDPIPHFDSVPITWPTAIGVISSVR